MILFEILFLQEGQFVWLSGDPIVFNSFGSGQPSNVLANTRDCIRLNLASETSKMTSWLTIRCTSLKDHRPICKREQTTTSESLDIGNY